MAGSVVFMPVADYVFTAEDLGAIVAYVKSVPPVDRTVPTMSVGPIARALGLFVDFPLASASLIDHSQPRLAPRPEPSDAVASGKYLVSSAGCYACHGAQLTGGWRSAARRTRTSPRSGSAAGASAISWSRCARTAGRTGRPSTRSMPRAYGDMSDEDLARIYAFLRTVPPAGAKTANQQKAAP